jgi:predicted site-specific integrase-resolvase
MALPMLTPLPDAATKIGMRQDSLEHLVNIGTVEAYTTPNGAIMIVMDDVNKHKVKLSDFAHLEGVPIHIAEAGRKYDLQFQSIARWRKAGYIRTLGREKNRILLNEADVAFIKAVIDEHGLKFGQSLGYVLRELND